MNLQIEASVIGALGHFIGRTDVPDLQLFSATVESPQRVRERTGEGISGHGAIKHF
jgi:hypothetical protein